MLSWCRDLCKPKKEKEKPKKDKAGKHGKDGKEEGKGAGKHKMKNVYHSSIVGQGKKNCDQDSASMFEMMEDNALVRFFGIYDGHGDFGREVSLLLFNHTLGITLGKCRVRAVHPNQY